MDDFITNIIGAFDMMGNYEQRKLLNTKRDEFILDTARVTDRSWVYETAVSHKKFNNGSWIILEGCNNKEEAEQTHNKWLQFLDNEDYNSLTDCYLLCVYSKSED